MSSPDVLRRLPKVQLHCHLEGTARPQTFLDLARAHNVSTDYGAEGFREIPPESVYDFATFEQFLFKFAALSRALQQPDEYVRLLDEYAADAAAQNVMYAELFISPSVWTFFHKHLDPRAVVERLYERALQIEAGSGPRIRFICDVTRNFGAERAMMTARIAADLQDCGVIGIGLGGDEVNYPPELFRDVFAFARGQGLHCVAHAGEAAGAQSVRDAVEILRAERIGHGIRAVEDSEVVQLLIERHIPLEISPTSNYCTGCVARDVAHPIKALYDAGVRIVVDSDDPGFFRADVTNELQLTATMLGDSAAVQIARNAIDASFASEDDKASMHVRFQTACAELLDQRRS